MKRRTYPLNVNNGFEDWGGYMQAKKQKLEDQFCLDKEKESSSHQSNIFKGVAIFVNGYTVPSAEELKFLMMQHGGVYHHYQSPRTTHIIASNLPDTKIKQLKGNLKIVKPEWIVDCIEKNKLLNYEAYLLYSNQSKTQPKLNFDVKVSPKKMLNSLEISKPRVISLNKSPENFFDSTISEVSDDKQPIEFCSNTSPNGKSEEKAVVSFTESSSKWEAKTASDDNFLTEFYNNSRLHHIATMGATFKDYVNELREKNGKVSPGRNLLKQEMKNAIHPDDDSDLFESQSSKSSEKVIMHIDMDCFFVSVGLRNHPELRGLPVAVTHSRRNPKRSEPNSAVKKELDLYKKRTIEKYKKTSSDGNDDLIAKRISWAENLGETDSMSEIASCSYEARKFGLKNGMFLGQALKLCPDLKTIPYDFEGYKEVSFSLYNCVASFTLDIEAVSCDEMFVDCSSLLNETGISALQFATILRRQIKEKTGCPCSTGFGSNKLLARLATRKAKPDGQFHITDNIAVNIMKTVNVSDLPGVGRANVYKLSTLGVKTCADLEKVSLEKLKSEFGGKTGMSLYKNCRGQDDKPLNFDHQRKSVSAEVNYGIRFKDNSEADVFLQKLSKEVQHRLIEVKMKGKCITLKVMVRAKDAPIETAKFLGHGVCDYTTKSVPLSAPTADSNIIYKEVKSILQQLAVVPQDLRGIGIQMSRLVKDNVSKSSLHNFLKKNDLNQNPGANTKVETDLSLIKKDTILRQPVETENKPDFDNPQPSTSKAYLAKGSKTDLFSSSKNEKKRVLEKPFIDNSVLDALPEDLKTEVLKQYQDQIEVFQQIEKEKKSSKLEEESCKQRVNTYHYELDLTLSQVDASFLEALPTDMRNELISEISSKSKSSSKRITSENVLEDNEKCESRKECKQTGKSHPLSCEEQNDSDELNDSEEFDFSIPISEIRTMIKEWISSEKEPASCDTCIFSKYMVHLVHSEELESLSRILNMLFRLIEKGNQSSWKAAYTKMVSAVQKSMMKIYGSKLLINEFFPP